MWCVLLCRIFAVTCSPICLISLLLLVLLADIQEIITKSSAVKFFPYVLFSKFCSFSFKSFHLGCKVKGPTSVFPIWISSCLHTIITKSIFSPLNSLDTLVENQLTISVKVFLEGLNSISLIDVSVIMLVPHYFVYYSFMVLKRNFFSRLFFLFGFP